MKRKHKIGMVVTVAIVGFGIAGGMVNAQASGDRPKFGVTPEPGSGSMPPEYSAVAGPDGEIAGYVHTATFDAGGPQPRTPEEAVAMTQTVKGNLYEVFDTDGNIVGYFADGDYGFIDSTAKDALIADGYRLNEAPRPDPNAPAPVTEPSSEGVTPSTPESEG